MKRTFILAVFLAIGITVGLTQDLQAQADKGAMRVGGALAFGTEIESLGIGGRFDYAITEQILLAPDLLYFFGKSEGEIDLNWFDINLNGNYLFDTGNPDVIPYALAGLNFAIISAKYDGFGAFGDSSSTEIGLNLGGGVDFILATLIIFGELRYAISSADQLVIAGGVKFPIN